MNHWIWLVSLVGILSTEVVFGTDMFFLTIGRAALRLASPSAGTERARSSNRSTANKYLDMRHWGGEVTGAVVSAAFARARHSAACSENLCKRVLK
jgi:hypothetical protein